jgi:hypothetical protein
MLLEMFLFTLELFGLRRIVSRYVCRKLDLDILMMKSAQDWATKNVPGAIDGARPGHVQDSKPR